MSPSTPAPAVDQLVQHVDFVRRLARSLVADADLAADAAQDTLAAAVRRPPTDGRNVRAWLATVLRRTLSRQRRARSSRQRRELEVAGQSASATEESAAAVVERAAMQRDLATCVLALVEPYRTAVVLRYFEDLSVDEVARRTGVPKNTARSRLTRGLAKLREALEQEHGSRTAWVAALLPLARPPVLSAPLDRGMTGSFVLGGVLVKQWIVAAVVIAAVGVIAVWQFSSPSGPLLDRSPPARTDAAAALAGGASRAAGVAADSPPPDRVAAEAPPGAAPPVVAGPTRRIVDIARQPLVGLRVRRHAATSVRWQAGDAGWIAGPSESLRLALADRERLRTDAAFAAEFFGARRYPDEWRAAILGTPLPDREVVTTADGAFDFGDAEPVTPADVTLVESGWTLLARPTAAVGDFVGAPAVELLGRLVDPEGRPIRGGFVTVDPSRAAAAATNEGLVPVEFGSMRSNRLGEFWVRQAPVAPGVLLRARAAGFRPAAVPVPATGAGFEIRLWPLGADERLLVEGVVVDATGRPLAATVAIGRETVRAGDDGVFGIQLDDVPSTASLTVLAAGWQVWQERGFGQRLLDDPFAGRQLRIALREPTRTLSGLLLGPDGAPLAGAGLNLVDPTLLDFSFTSVEARVGGRGRQIGSDADGRFELTGLGDRPYLLRVWHRPTGLAALVGPFSAVDGETIVQLPATFRQRTFRGRVVEQDGEPLTASAVVKLVHCVYVGRTGGTLWADLGSAEVGPAGRFEIAGAAAGDAVLLVEDDAGRRAVAPVAELDGGDITLTIPTARRWVRLLPSAVEPGLPVTFVAVDGRPRRVICRDSRGVTRGWSLTVAEPVLVEVPADAVAVVVAAGTPLERRVELDPATTHVHVRGRGPLGR